MGFWDIVTVPVRIATAPITLPAEVVVNVVTGNKPPLQPIRDVAEGVKEVAAVTGDIVNAPDRLIIDLSHRVLGDTGKIVAEVAVGGRMYEVQAAVQTVEAFANILTGGNPLEVLAVPLASAIAVAASEFTKSAEAVPAWVRSLLSEHFEHSLLDRARYTIGSVGINLPEVINTSQRFMGTHAHAVTVDNVIVFSQEPSNDITGLNWWAHEIQHVAQYTAWGINSFAYKYITDWQSVESEAEGKASAVISVTDAYHLSAVSPAVVTVAPERAMAFRFYYPFDPEPGWRVWSCNGNAWAELYPSGRVGKFTYMGNATVEGLPGITVQRDDGGLHVFIANQNSPKRWLYFQLPGTAQWQFLGVMHNAR